MIPRLTKTVTQAGYVFGGLFLLLLLIYAYDVSTYHNRIFRGVALGGQEISGMDRYEFQQYIASIQEDFESKRVFIEYDLSLIEVRPSDLGIEFQEEALWKEAYQYGREDDIVSQFLYWIRSFNHSYDLSLVTVTDNGILDETISNWYKQIPPQEPYNGRISISNGVVTIDHPQPGYSIDTETLLENIIAHLLYEPSGAVIPVTLDLVEPQRSQQDIADNAHYIQQIIGTELELYVPNDQERQVVLSPRDLADTSYLIYPEQPDDMILLDINKSLLTKKLEPLYPRDASFVINDDETVTIVPSSDGYDIDVASTASKILKRAYTNKDRIAVEVYDYLEASFTTEDAQSLGIQKLVSRFTTYHNCCESRVRNIQKVADIIDGTVLAPGEILDMNKLLGERTQERGFEPAGTIIEGELQETVGGGISQFVTTFHNTVYWGGYEIIAHKPHSRYFSRYPVGIEATINWPYVDYIFKNDFDTGLLIRASYTDTSITISFYADNNGRVAIGEHKGGATSINVEGTTDASRIVVSRVSPPYLQRDPVVVYEPNDGLAQGEEQLVSVGDERWSVMVERTVLQADDLVHYDLWPVHYQGEPTIIERHPCDIPGTSYDLARC
jgi:vancomycin resistance protein YoaR